MRKTIVLTVTLDDSDVDNDGMSWPTDQEIVDNTVEDLNDTEAWIESSAGTFLANMSVRLVSIDGVLLYDATSEPYVMSDESEQAARDLIEHGYMPRHAAIA